MLKSIGLFSIALLSSVCSFVAVREFISFQDPIPLLSILTIIFILGVTRVIPSSARTDHQKA